MNGKNRKINNLLPPWEIKIKRRVRIRVLTGTHNTIPPIKLGFSTAELTRPLNNQQATCFHPLTNKKPNQYWISSNIVPFQCSAGGPLWLVPTLNTSHLFPNIPHCLWPHWLRTSLCQCISLHAIPTLTLGRTSPARWHFGKAITQLHAGCLGKQLVRWIMWWCVDGSRSTTWPIHPYLYAVSLNKQAPSLALSSIKWFW